MNVVTKQSGKMVCGALLASICTVAAPQDAFADPGTIGFQAFVNQGTSTMQGGHVFGTQNQQFIAPAPTYFVLVSTGPSNRPGWEYEMTIDWNPFNPSFFGASTRFIVNLTIKPEDTPNPISLVGLKGGGGAPMPGIVTWTNGTIHIDVHKQDLTAGGNFMIIQWNQDPIPAPGALALLGLAGMVGGRRRRE